MPRPHHAQRTVLHAVHSISVTIGVANTPPEFAVQPPVSALFRLGTPSSIGFGTVQDDDGDPITVTVEPILPAGFALTRNGNDLTLNWDGTGTEGTYVVRVAADDGV